MNISIIEDMTIDLWRIYIYILFIDGEISYSLEV